MRKSLFIMTLAFLLTVLTATAGLAGYVCEYSNSDGTGNDATNRVVGIAVLSEDNFVMSINRESVPVYALCKWTDATATTGRGNDVTQWYYNFDTVNLENPFGLATDEYGYVYVANNDLDHNILVFDASGPDLVATAYRLPTATDDTLYAIDTDDNRHVYVCYCNAEQDRVDIYPSVLDDAWIAHEGDILASISLPDGLYYGMCVNAAGTEVYVSEYTSSTIHRYTGSVGEGFTLDPWFSVQVDSLATAIDLDDQGYLYVTSDFASSILFENPAGYSWFWVVDLATGAVTDKVDMYSPNGGQASETSAGYHSAVDIEVDEAGNVYVVHYYAWAVEKWAGEPSTGVDIVQSGEEMPRQSILVRNYPNPFNASTQIRYSLSEATHVRLDVFNVTGQLVEGLVDREQPAGQHMVSWNARNLPSGIYLVRLQAGQEMATSKMVLVR